MCSSDLSYGPERQHLGEQRKPFEAKDVGSQDQDSAHTDKARNEQTTHHSRPAEAAREQVMPGDPGTYR